MKKMNKKLHQWAQENNCHIWELRKKRFWQNLNELNGTYKLNAEFMVTIKGFMVMSKTAFEVFDDYLNSTILVTEHGVVNIEKNKGDWQMYRR